MKAIDCCISERDIALLLSVELDSSEAFAREMIKWLKLPDGELENFSSGLIRTGENGSCDIGFFCRIDQLEYAAILENRFWAPLTSRDYRRLTVLWLKYHSGKNFRRVKHAVLAPEKYLAESVSTKHTALQISHESIKNFLRQHGGRRGRVLSELMERRSCGEK